MKLYKSRQRRDDCPFCDEKSQTGKVIYENNSIYVIPNLTKYDLWEMVDVTDHLLVIPKRHVTALSQLSKAERLDIMNTCADYEEKGYSVYARGVGFIKRSVEHQHTHLIKTKNVKARLMLFMKRPYILIKF